LSRSIVSRLSASGGYGGPGGTGKTPPGGSSSATYTTTSFSINNSYNIHGPFIDLAYQLPWKIGVELFSALMLKSYLYPERVLLASSNTLVTLPVRQDQLLLIEANLWRPLAWKMAIGSRYQVLVNFSNISLEGETGLDHNYTRHQAIVYLRWAPLASGGN
jgi:hypothetical protein